MGESYQCEHQELHRSSRLGERNSGDGGEIVEVDGGHIVRATGRKDRHSKVCTARGPRDRRVRLSAHTAIQFYDVQDRLGYDRPSKAVDWLIKKAKTAIDELAELPAWTPTATAAAAANKPSIFGFEQNEDTNHHELSRFERHRNDGIIDTQNSDGCFFKSFFPTGASSTPTNSKSSGMQFHQSFQPPDLLSRSGNQSQDLRLSLQSFDNPILHHQHNEENNGMFLDGSVWQENQSGGFQRMLGWGGSGSGDDAVSGGFVFSSQPAQTTSFLQTTNSYLFNNNSQRGPLQSSNTPSIRAWTDQPRFAGAAISGFTSGFSEFLIPARIHGEQEEHDDKPSSASSDSRH